MNNRIKGIVAVSHDAVLSYCSCQEYCGRLQGNQGKWSVASRRRSRPSWSWLGHEAWGRFAGQSLAVSVTSSWTTPTVPSRSVAPTRHGHVIQATLTRRNRATRPATPSRISSRPWGGHLAHTRWPATPRRRDTIISDPPPHPHQLPLPPSRDVTSGIGPLFSTGLC